jgi:uncharacterized protein (TIGR02246 family)
MKRLQTLATATLFVLLTAAPSFASEARRGGRSPRAVRKVVAAYMAAFNQGDAKALATLWTPSGDLLGPRGELLKGRDAIQKGFEEFFAVNQDTRLRINVASIRFVGTDVAVLDGTTEVIPPLQGPPAEIRATVILVRRGDQWLIESARDTLVPTPSNYNQLKELEWMIGEWENAPTAGDNVSVESMCGWTVNKNFIVRRFSAQVRDRVSAAGTQVIGWDPREDAIRSWAFDSTGGFAQAVWKRDGRRWIITTSDVFPDGTQVSATNIVTKVDDDTFTFQSTSRTRNGQPEPDIEEIKVCRKALPAGRQPRPILPEKPTRETILPE